MSEEMTNVEVAEVTETAAQKLERKLQESRDRERILQFNKVERMYGAKLSTSIEEINRRWSNNIGMVACKAERHHERHLEVKCTVIITFSDGSTKSHTDICQYKACKDVANSMFYDDYVNNRDVVADVIEFIVPGQSSRPKFYKDEYYKSELTAEEKHKKIKDDPEYQKLDNPDLIQSRKRLAVTKMPKCNKRMRNPKTTRVTHSRG